jgi:hypothetical protein
VVSAIGISAVLIYFCQSYVNSDPKIQLWGYTSIVLLATSLLCLQASHHIPTILKFEQNSNKITYTIIIVISIIALVVASNLFDRINVFYDRIDDLWLTQLFMPIIIFSEMFSRVGKIVDRENKKLAVIFNNLATFFNLLTYVATFIFIVIKS